MDITTGSPSNSDLYCYRQAQAIERSQKHYPAAHTLLLPYRSTLAIVSISTTDIHIHVALLRPADSSTRTIEREGGIQRTGRREVCHMGGVVSKLRPPPVDRNTSRPAGIPRTTTLVDVSTWCQTQRHKHLVSRIQTSCSIHFHV